MGFFSEKRKMDLLARSGGGLTPALLLYPNTHTVNLSNFNLKYEFNTVILSVQVHRCVDIRGIFFLTCLIHRFLFWSCVLWQTYVKWWVTACCWVHQQQASLILVFELLCF
jgi:hypothetical protein